MLDVNIVCNVTHTTSLYVTVTASVPDMVMEYVTFGECEM